MTPDKWVWMPHAAHFICGPRCQFKLATYVGKYIVSTVGEMVTNHLDERTEFEEIGYKRKYETMVFRAIRRDPKNGKCCPWEIDVSKEMDMQGYNDADAATDGHMAMCRKWSTTARKGGR